MFSSFDAFEISNIFKEINTNHFEFFPKKYPKEPQPFEPPTSDEIINKKFARFGTMSCQPDLMISKITIGMEDCLHLSVFTHDISPSTLKPCMVWIHGGAFIFGSKSKELFNPEFLLRKQIVLIAINYRLGALGK